MCCKWKNELQEGKPKTLKAANTERMQSEKHTNATPSPSPAINHSAVQSSRYSLVSGINTSVKGPLDENISSVVKPHSTVQQV